MERKSGQNEYYLSDALGSVIGLADGNGAIKTSYNYSPFGKKQTTGITSGNPFAFTGREDDGTGYYYYRARYYSPDQKRFIGEDPLEFGGGDTNFYAYVGGNPVNFTDPSGNGPINGAIGAGVCAAGIIANGALAVASVGTTAPIDAMAAVAICSGAGIGASAVPDPTINSDITDPGPGSFCALPTGFLKTTPAPFLPGDDYSPESVSKRQSELRRQLGTGNASPETPIPDQGSGSNIKGSHSADTKARHGTGERNVGTVEEHSRKAKGSNGLPRRK